MQQKNHDIIIILTMLVVIKSTLFLWGNYQFDFSRFEKETAVSIWNRWDAKHYQKIAEYGYGKVDEVDDNRFLINFPPLFPALIRIVSKLFMFDYIHASFAVSNMFSFLSSLFLFLIAKHERKSRFFGFKAVLIMNLFPTAYFFLAPFSESTFLFFILLGFYCLRVRESYGLAFLSVSLAILTRSAGVILIPVFLCFLLCHSGFRARSLWYVLMPLISWNSQHLIGYLYFDDIFMIYKYRPLYVIQLGYIPFYEAYNTFLTILNDISKLQDQTFMMKSGWGMFFLVSSFLMILASIKQFHWRYTLFGLGYLLFLSCFTWAIPMPRYILCCFPLFFILAGIKNIWGFGLVSIFSFGLQLYFSSIFVRGPWAF